MERNLLVNSCLSQFLQPVFIGLQMGCKNIFILCVLRYILLTIFRKEHCFYKSDFNLFKLYLSLLKDTE